MKFFIALIVALSSLSTQADTHVRGYTRKDGTYVAPHTRSSPDSYKSNNYGSGSGYVRSRDSDKDGTPNYLDQDDNNNGAMDDNE